VSPAVKRRRKHRIPRGVIETGTGPFEGVLRLDRTGTWRPVAAVALAVGIHAGLYAFALRIPPPRPVAPRQIPIVMAAPPPPKPPAEPPKPPEPRPPPEARHVRNKPPPPAQAAKVVRRAPEPSQPLDFTGFDMVTGDGTTYAGGYTSAKGTNKAPVADANPKPHAPPAPPHVSEARLPGPAREDWSCAWPDDAAESELRDARVSVRVDVDRDGAPKSAHVVASPAPSFAQAAEVCAMSEQYRAGLDDYGHRTPGTTPIFVVHFIR
jgi:hypothetical protein